MVTKGTDMSISPAGLVEQSAELRSELLDACTRVIDSGWFVLGQEVEAFEREYADWVGVEHAIGVASGTDALELALRALGIGEGDEVIVPANAVPTPYGVTASGATVRFCDVRELDYQLDPDDVARSITDHTRAIIAVHLYGHPAPIDERTAVVGDRDIRVVEDCAQAHGAALHGIPVGQLGDIACWSFFPTKNLGALGDGGAVTCRDQDVADHVRSLRMYGETRRYHSVRLGTNSRLDELQAALLRTKLPRLDAWIDRRRAIAATYDDRLVDLVTLPPVRDGATSGRHLYPIRVAGRDQVLERLKSDGIPAAIHYPIGAHDQPCFASLRDRDLPVTSALASSVLLTPRLASLRVQPAQCGADRRGG
jgi:dTDP-4-amino-4,6-dideoxygalactose transaminase